jgi:hypothetical protein
VDRSSIPYLPRRRAWQAGFFVLALIPTASALFAVGVGAARFVDDDRGGGVGAVEVDAALDSTYRYFGGVYLGVALLALWCLPRIEARANALVFATGAIFLGGVGRLISAVDVGAPTNATWLVLVIEMGAVFLALIMRSRIRPAALDGRPDR